MSDEEYEDIHYGSGYLDDDRTTKEIIEDLHNFQPLFTLTAEEVEMLEQIIGAALHTYRKTYIAFKNTCLANDWQDAIDKCNNLLTRIKQWQDENNN